MSPGFLTVLTTSDILIKLSTARTHTSTSFKISIIAPRTDSTRTAPLSPTTTRTVRSTRFLRTPTPTGLTPTDITTRPASASAVIPIPLPNDDPRTTTITGASSILPLTVPRIAALVPIDAIPRSLRSMMSRCHPAAAISLTIRAPRPALSLDHDPDLRNLPTDPARLDRNPQRVDPRRTRQVLSKTIRQQGRSRAARAPRRPSDRTARTPPTRSRTPPTRAPTPDTPADTRPRTRPQMLMTRMLIRTPRNRLAPSLVGLICDIVRAHTKHAAAHARLRRSVGDVFTANFFTSMSTLPRSASLNIHIAFVTRPGPILASIHIANGRILPRDRVSHVFTSRGNSVVGLLSFRSNVLRLGR